MEIQILYDAFDERGALEMLLNTDHNLVITDISEVYYPYLRYRHSMTVGKRKTKIKAKKLSDCIVDRVYGTLYIADGQPDYIMVDVDPENILDTVMPMEYCDQHAHQFALKEFLEKAKLLMTPEIEIVKRDEFYKKYYIVECINDSGMEYYVMVDAVDGSLSVLDNEGYAIQYAELQEDYNAQDYIEQLKEEAEAAKHKRIEEQTDADTEIKKEEDNKAE